MDETVSRYDVMAGIRYAMYVRVCLHVITVQPVEICSANGTFLSVMSVCHVPLFASKVFFITFRFGGGGRGGLASNLSTSEF